MNAPTAVEDTHGARSECWCCGMTEAPEKLVRLGNHPEVTLCVRCAYSVAKWAWEIEDQAKTGYAARGRNAFRRARVTVVRKGWHRHPLVGRPLRRLGKYLP